MTPTKADYEAAQQLLALFGDAIFQRKINEASQLICDAHEAERNAVLHLVSYLSHDDDCKGHYPEWADCSCGLMDTLKEYRQATEEE